MTALDSDTIARLLAANSRSSGGTKTPAAPRVRPIQIGPLRYTEETGKCANRGCASPTHIKVEGVRRCTSHALYHLNYILLQTHDDWGYVSDAAKVCTCNAGRHSSMNVHTEGCPIFERVNNKPETTDYDS